MYYKTIYKSPIGNLLVVAKDDKLVGIWFEGQKYFLSGFKDEKFVEGECTILLKTKDWLRRYFNGERPKPLELDIELLGSEFRKEVWRILCEIPYGEVITYKRIAEKIAKNRGLDRMSAQAVGNAVGHNPISIVIPCHRVVGVSGSLTGYAGGLDRKRSLLELEGVCVSSFK